MSKARPQVLSLNGGEVDAEAIARSDIDSYANKAAIYENALPAVKGGLYRAPGTRFIGYTLEGAHGEHMGAVVRAWRYSRSQAFTIEMGHEQLRLVYGTGYVQVGTATAEFDEVTGWDDDSTGGGASAPDLPTWPALPSVAPHGVFDDSWPGFHVNLD